jgi:hypothetical protein
VIFCHSVVSRWNHGHAHLRRSGARIDPPDIAITLTWLDAYDRCEDDPPVIDKFAADARYFGDYCAAYSAIGLITVADKLFAK